MKILAFAFVFFISLAHAADTPRVINITTGQWPPYLDQSKRDQGCVAALIRDAFALHDIKVRFIFMPWQRAYEEGKKAAYAGSAYWYYSKRRALEYIYTQHAPTIETSRFYHHESLPLEFRSYQDLKPFKLLLNKGLTYPDELLAAIDKYQIQTLHNTYASKNVALILRDRADVMIMNERTAEAYMADLAPQDATQIVAQEVPAFIRKGYLLINKHQPQLAAVFDDGISTLWSDGDYVADYHQRCSWF